VNRSIPPVDTVRDTTAASWYLRRLDWYFFARPVLMPPVWTILLLAAAPTTSIQFNALPAASLRVWAALCLSFFLFGGVYILNQIFDVESDRLNRKLFFLPEGIMSRHWAWTQYVVFTLIALGGGAALGRSWSVAAVAVVIQGILYSVPVVRLKDRPLGGLLANAIGQGTLVYYLGRAVSGPHTVPVWGGSISYAFAVAGVYLLTTIPDRAGDERAGKRTLCVRFGPRQAAAAATFCVLAAGVMGVVNEQWAMVITAGLSLPLCALAVVAEKCCGTAVRVALLVLSFFTCLVFWPYIFVLVLIWVSTRWYYRRRFGVTYPRLSAGG